MTRSLMLAALLVTGCATTPPEHPWLLCRQTVVATDEGVTVAIICQPMDPRQIEPLPAPDTEQEKTTI